MIGLMLSRKGYKLHLPILVTVVSVACSVGLHTVLELGAMVDRLESSQLQTINLTSNDLVKDHLRHLVTFLQ